MAWLENGQVHTLSPDMLARGYVGSANPMASMAITSHARGGGIKRKGMILAHFNPHELNVLDHLQGKRERCPRTGLRSYAGLEGVLKNPHIANNLLNVAAQTAAEGGHLAEGGVYASGGYTDGGALAHGGTARHGLHNYHNAHLNRMANAGVHGDTEVALIGPHTRNLFDHMVEAHGHAMGQRVINPVTGHPHYGFLDGILGGIGKVLSPVVNVVKKIPIVGNLVGGLADTLGGKIKEHAPAVVSAAGNLAQRGAAALAQKYGGDRAANIVNSVGNFANQQLQNQFTPEQQAAGQQLAQQGQALGQQAYNTYQQGGIRGLASQGLQGLASQVGGQAWNQYGPQVMNYGQQMLQGQVLPAIQARLG